MNINKKIYATISIIIFIYQCDTTYNVTRCQYRKKGVQMKELQVCDRKGILKPDLQNLLGVFVKIILFNS